MRRKEFAVDDAFYSGYLSALGVVYNFEPDPTATLTQEIVNCVCGSDLLRVAKKERDCYLPLLKITIKSLRDREKWKNRRLGRAEVDYDGR